MAYKSIKMLALAGLLTLVEGKTNQGAVNGTDLKIDAKGFVHIENFAIGAPKEVTYTIDNILDTLTIPSEVITKEFLKTKIFIHSKNTEYNPLYASLDNIVDSLSLDSLIVDKTFVKNYFRAIAEEKLFYNARQVKVRTTLDTLDLGSNLVNRKLRKAISKIESEYGLKNTSPVGAEGPMQVMPKTWPHYSQKSFKYFSKDPSENISVGVKYLLKVEKMFSNDKNFQKYIGNWEDIPLEVQEEYLAAAYNGGYGRLTDRRFNIKRMPKETVEYVEKFKEAKLLISIEDVFDFKQFPDTTYSYSSRIRDLTKYLSLIESCVSKNYSKWSKLDESAQTDIIIAASVLGPKRLTSKLKAHHKKGWDFRNILPQIYARVNNFQEQENIASKNNNWNYSNPRNITTYMANQRIVDGLEELLSIEKKLSEKHKAWSMMTLEAKRNLILLSSIYGVDSIIKPPVGSKELLADANKAFEVYSKQSQSEALMNKFFAYISPR